MGFVVEGKIDAPCSDDWFGGVRRTSFSMLYNASDRGPDGARAKTRLTFDHRTNVSHFFVMPDMTPKRCLTMQMASE